MKIYNKPPLAFYGNKKNCIKEYRKIIQEAKDSGVIKKETLIIDVFGGSGLLAHEAKRILKDNEVIWNDYDNYQERLDNIETTEKLRAEFLEIVKERKYHELLSRDEREKIIEILNERKKDSYIDYIQLSSYLLFVGIYTCDFESQKSFYNGVAKARLDKTGYLQGVKRERLDFRELLDKYKEQESFLILDPPYYATGTGHYEKAFPFKDIKELGQKIKKPFLFFQCWTSNMLDLYDFEYEVVESGSVGMKKKDIYLICKGYKC